MKKNLFLTGEKQVGKSTVIQKALADRRLRVGGFRTLRSDAMTPGRYGVYLLRAAQDEQPSAENCLFLCGRPGADLTERFDRLGARALADTDCDLILMDELGPNECRAAVFQREVQAALDGPRPVLGVLQKADSAFLGAIAQRQDTCVIVITPENRETAVQLVGSWLSEAAPAKRWAVSAGILAGGSSVRMGRDKTQLDHGGDTFVSYMAEQCGFLPQVLVSVRDARQAIPSGCEAVVDERQGTGPLEGIYQLLCTAREPRVLIVAADMPYLTAAFLQRMLGCVKPQDDCTVLQSAGGVEPLCGIYSRSVLPVLAQLRQQNMRSPRQLLQRVNTHYVTADELGLTPDQVTKMAGNINTPADYAAFAAQKGGDKMGDF